MYLQKGISIKLREKKLFIVGILNVTDDKRRIHSQRYGSEDPDPHPELYQVVTDPEHCMIIYP
jgi:hypothetical protein